MKKDTALTLKLYFNKGLKKKRVLLVQQELNQEIIAILWKALNGI